MSDSKQRTMGTMPLARAARNMFSVVSRSALPCSLSNTMKSNPAKAHISTMAGFGRLLNAPRNGFPLRSMAGKRVSIGNLFSMNVLFSVNVVRFGHGLLQQGQRTWAWEGPTLAARMGKVGDRSPRSRTEPLVSTPDTPSPSWTAELTSPQKEPIPGCASSSCITTTTGTAGSLAATYR